VLKILRVLTELRVPDLSEEAANKLFVLLKCLVSPSRGGMKVADEIV
jgi:hypothetical protein